MDLHLHGTISFPARDGPSAIDLDVDEFDMSPIGEPVKYPHCLLRGIYQLDGNELVICFHESVSAPRPTEFRPPKDGILLRLVRARHDFDQFPREVTVRVQDPQGRPAVGVSVYNYMSFFVRGVAKPNDPPPTWKYHELAKTGADGAAQLPYRDLRAALARDSTGQLVGVTEVSPASALAGDFIVQLRPCCKLLGTIACEALRRANKPIGWTNAVLYQQNGQQIAECSSTKGEFEFIIAPGRYTLYTYGASLDGQSLSVEVPPGAGIMRKLAPISAGPLNLALLASKPALVLPDHESMLSPR